MTDANAQIATLDDLYGVLAERSYEPLWTIKGALTPEPQTQMLPYLWRYPEVRDLILQAGELISAEEADRRVLAFKNPGTADHEIARTTDSLWAAIQLVMPGEVAPPHRHSPAALRYVIEGEGAYTVVDGRRVAMEAGDFIVTPNWTWHEHGHEGQGPMLWLDGLDLPMVHTLHLVFAQFTGTPPAAGDGRSVHALDGGRLLPAWNGAPEARTLVWKLDEVEAALAGLASEDGSPADDLILEYRDPANPGKPLMPTLTAYMQMLRPGVETEAHRHTSSAVYHVVRGSGWSEIGGEKISWGPGDTFALPVWAEHRHANPGDTEALLFSFSDRPAVEALGLLREA
jgi:gentisate 1,2-dioxygenase